LLNIVVIRENKRKLFTDIQLIMKPREIKGKEERAVVLTVNQRVVGSSPTGGAKGQHSLALFIQFYTRLAIR